MQFLLFLLSSSFVPFQPILLSTMDEHDNKKEGINFANDNILKIEKKFKCNPSSAPIHWRRLLRANADDYFGSERTLLSC